MRHHIATGIFVEGITQLAEPQSWVNLSITVWKMKLTWINWINLSINVEDEDNYCMDKPEGLHMGFDPGAIHNLLLLSRVNNSLYYLLLLLLTR